MDEDCQLMCRVREGEMEPFTLLFNRYRQPVESFLFRLFWDHEKARDGAQEVFLRLWIKRRNYRPSARFTTFLYRVAYNYWVDQVRKARARPVEVEIPREEETGPSSRLLMAASTAEPERYLFMRYQQWRIQAAIASLPEIYRIVFILAHLEDRKIAEIAEILEIPGGTVKSRLHTAIRMLRGRLADLEKE